MLPTLDSITLDVSAWTLDHREEFLAVWTDDDGDILALNFFPIAPDLPPHRDSVRLQEEFQQKTAAQGARLVEVDALLLDEIGCIRSILRAQQPAGVTFQGSCIVPRRDFSYVLRVQAREAGSTAHPAMAAAEDPAQALNRVRSKLDALIGSMRFAEAIRTAQAFGEEA